MFSGLMAKISAGLALLSGFLYFWAKSERTAKKKAQHKNEIHDKIEENREKQEEFKAEVLADEPERIKEAIESRAKLSRHDRASKL